jgi:diaminopimelate epimerase
MEIAFTKMNGAGNDFVVVDNRDGSLALDQATIARLCNRQRGIGSDGLLAVEPAQAGATHRMRYYNADGGEAEMCGNGARCFARFASRLTGDVSDRLSFETIAGVISARLLGENVELAMSEPHSLAAPVDLTIDGTLTSFHFVNTGVPHAVLFVQNLASTDVIRLGSGIRHHAHFAPAGTNVNFVQIDPDADSIAIRTFERGVEGETLACGTGVVAAALLHHLVSGATSPVSVRVQGGDTLQVGFTKTSANQFSEVTLTGPADFVFDGRITL